jgi:hypothetical protein
MMVVVVSWRCVVCQQHTSGFLMRLVMRRFGLSQIRWQKLRQHLAFQIQSLDDKFQSLDLAGVLAFDIVLIIAVVVVARAFLKVTGSTRLFGVGLFLEQLVALVGLDRNMALHKRQSLVAHLSRLLECRCVLVRGVQRLQRKVELALLQKLRRPADQNLGVIDLGEALCQSGVELFRIHWQRRTTTTRRRRLRWMGDTVRNCFRESRWIGVAWRETGRNNN